jgi:hypothetical protein
MHHSSFDALTAAISRPGSRRTATRLLGSLVALPLAGSSIAAAKKKKKKKVTLCLNGETIKASTKKKKNLLKQGATSGPCTAKSCVSNAECGSGAICASGTCQTCSVTCNGDSAACGAALQQRLDQGGTVYVCPGRYANRFVAGVVTVIGAGSGEDPAANTILDAQNLGRTVSLNNGVTASLSRLRITGGAVGGSDGGGLYGKNCDLTVTACAFEGNAAQSGGGLWVEGGRLQMGDTVVENNTATTYSGGGVFIYGGAEATIANSHILGNRASSAGSNTLGGGILLESAELTIVRSEVSRNSATAGGGGAAVYGSTGILTLDSATRIVSNTAGASKGGGGILLINGGKVNLNGATLDLNVPDNVRTI